MQAFLVLLLLLLECFSLVKTLAFQKTQLLPFAHNPVPIIFHLAIAEVGLSLFLPLHENVCGLSSSETHQVAFLIGSCRVQMCWRGGGEKENGGLHQMLSRLIFSLYGAADWGCFFPRSMLSSSLEKEGTHCWDVWKRS